MITPTGQNKALEGDISVELSPQVLPQAPGDTVRFGVRIADRALHERYAIEAVPTTLIADPEGVVVASFLGPVTATDLWAAVAEAREPGSTPRACEH